MVQGFINSSFENITSTEHALNLLRQFQAILQRDTLKVRQQPQPGDASVHFVLLAHNQEHTLPSCSLLPCLHP